MLKAFAWLVYIGIVRTFLIFLRGCFLFSVGRTGAPAHTRRHCHDRYATASTIFRLWLNAVSESTAM